MDDDFGEFLERMFRQPRRRIRVTIPREPPPSLALIPVDDDKARFIQAIYPFRDEPELRIVMTTATGAFIGEFSVLGGGRFNKDFLPQFYNGPSGSATFIPSQNGASLIQVYRPQTLQGINLQQTFRDNNNICVFEAIYKKFQELDEPKTKKTAQNRQSRLNKVRREEVNYPDGVRADQLEDLANEIEVRFVLCDVLGNTTAEYGKARQIVVKILNTRKDHVDFLTSNDPIPVTEAFLNEKLFSLREAKEHYVVKNSLQTITNLSTPEQNYILDNPDAEVLHYMNDQVKHCRYDALQYPELNEFLKKGRLINSTYLHFQDWTPDTKLYDMKQAYTRHADCPFYEGFLSQIQQYRSTDKIHAPGIYQFKLHTDTEFSRRVGLIKGNSYILPSPEIRYWKKTLHLSITAGAWGLKKDLHYSPEIIQRKLYARWAGSLSMNDNYRSTKYTFPATEEFASHIKSIYPETFYWETGEASVNIPNPKVKVAHHILAFITSYTRINMLLAMEKLTNVQGVLLDGIYTTDTIANPIFVEKPLNVISSDYTPATSWYEPANPFYPPPLVHLTSCVLSGAGGSGKTHSILNDKGYIHPLYVVPTHELGKGKHYTTIHRLVGEKCDAYHIDHGVPAVVLIDELTMIKGDWITRALEMYPDTLFFLAGDLDDKQHYQCRSGNPTEYWDIWKPTLPIVHFTNDYRAKTEVLKRQKEEIRQEMRKVYTDGGLTDTHKMRMFVRHKYKFITFKEAIAQATPDDIFLWSTKKVEALIPEHLQKLGVHKSQGTTLTNPKVYITADWFEYAMPYTALSRCVDHRQVQFVYGL